MTVKEVRDLLEVITWERSLVNENIDDIEVVLYDSEKERACSINKIYMPVNLVYTNKVIAIC
jgi:hypothetical protein